MTKQEKIQEAYGEYWEKVKDYVYENGWCSGFWGETFEKLNGYTKPNSEGTRWRPKSLKGIETNNGWIKIESENDLPKEPCFYWCMDNNGIMHQIHYDDIEVGDSSHYQPIQKPQPPIY